VTPPPAMADPALRETAARAPRRWYTHGWNRPLAWELILRVTPRLPRFALRPLHHLTTSLCFAMMHKERAAARRNLSRVTGRGGFTSLRLAYRLFFNFSRFMVAYSELRDLRLAQIRHRLIGIEPVQTALEKLIDEGRGAIIMTMHLGHWDLGLKLMAGHETPVHVVMLNEDPQEVTRYADEARAMPNLKVHQSGSSPLLAVELMTALRRGELVAVQADRAFGSGSSTMAVDLFGAPASLPTGPAQLAMATGAPILPIFVVFDRGDTYRIVVMPVMRFERAPRASQGDDAALREAMRSVAACMESVVSRFPDQWFNFFDVWPANGP